MRSSRRASSPVLILGRARADGQCFIDEPGDDDQVADEQAALKRACSESDSPFGESLSPVGVTDSQGEFCTTRAATN